MKYAWISQHEGQWPTRAMCRVLEASSSGFYEWRGRSASRRAQEDARLMQGIKASFEQSRGAYGSPRIWQELRQQGEGCGRNRVARLMRHASLQARPKAARRQTHEVGGEHQVASNLLKRNFTADRPNCKWVADFTFIRTAQGWLYFAAVMDLYSRRIVGWSMSEKADAQLVIDALRMALKQRHPPGELVHHSDQGVQYTSEAFQEELRRHRIACSMSRRGNCLDNAAMESFFSSLKTERLSRRAYASHAEARADVFDYVECFYNTKRRHSTLNYASPASFEAALAG